MDESKLWKGWGNYVPEDLTKLAIIYRSAKKICRKCFKRLPADATKCSNPKCHNTDLRFKKNSNNCYASKTSFNIENNFYKKVKKLK